MLLACGISTCARPVGHSPQTWNYLLNPEHPDAKKIEVAEVVRERFDNRLFRFGRGDGAGLHLGSG